METVFTTVLGNIHDDAAWGERLQGVIIEYLDLDPWTAQKSRFIATSTTGRPCAVALGRHARVADGDILCYAPDAAMSLVVRVALSPVMVIDLTPLADRDAQEAVRAAVELGHALGNQHWPAVVSGWQVYVPLTVDQTVMRSVMETHHFEGISYSFQSGRAVIPYLAPHEVRRLFGGAGDGGHAPRQKHSDGGE